MVLPLASIHVMHLHSTEPDAQAPRIFLNHMHVVQQQNFQSQSITEGLVHRSTAGEQKGKKKRRFLLGWPEGKLEHRTSTTSVETAVQLCQSAISGWRRTLSEISF